MLVRASRDPSPKIFGVLSLQGLGNILFHPEGKWVLGAVTETTHRAAGRTGPRVFRQKSALLVQPMVRPASQHQSGAQRVFVLLNDSLAENKSNIVRPNRV